MFIKQLENVKCIDNSRANVLFFATIYSVIIEIGFYFEIKFSNIYI